ncbi:MAG: hypothetical protein V1494_03755 [Candidatus Diapherotrites archaeon]
MFEMIAALIGAAFGLVKKPVVLLAAIILAIINTVVFFLLFEPIAELLYNFFVLGLVPEGNAWELPFRFLQLYFLNSIAILVAMFISLMLFIWLLFVAAAAEKEKDSAIAEANSRLGEIFWLSAFIFIAVFVFLAIGYIFMAIGFSFDLLALPALIVFLAWLLVGLYVFVKLSFVAVIAAMEKVKGKEAFIKTWQWSAKRFWGIIVFLLLAGFIFSLINALGDGVAGITGEEISGIVIGLIFAIIANAYVALAMAKAFSVTKE